MKKKVILIMDFFAFHSKKASELLLKAKYLFLLLVLMSSAHGNLFSENNGNIDNRQWLTPGQERIMLANALNRIANSLENYGQQRQQEELNFQKQLMAAQRGNAYAQYKMGCSNNKLKRYWYQLAAQKGQSEAIKWLHENPEYGKYDTIAIKRPSGLLLEIFKTANEKLADDSTPYRFLKDPLYDAILYLSGTKQNNVQDMYNLACCYMKGIKSNERKAIILLQQAADLGCKDARTLLSTIFMKKILKGENCVELVSWFNKYAKKNWVIAKYYLGLLYYNGIAVDKDYNYAVYWFKEAAINGCAEAQLDLSNCYFNGHGIEMNLKIGQSWYSLAERTNAINLRGVDF